MIGIFKSASFFSNIAIGWDMYTKTLRLFKPAIFFFPIITLFLNPIAAANVSSTCSYTLEKLATGERTITVHYELTNNGTTPVTYSFSSGCQFDFAITDSSDSLIYHYMSDKACSTLMTEITIAPSETTTNDFPAVTIDSVPSSGWYIHAQLIGYHETLASEYLSSSDTVSDNLPDSVLIKIAEDDANSYCPSNHHIKGGTCYRDTNSHFTLIFLREYYEGIPVTGSIMYNLKTDGTINSRTNLSCPDVAAKVFPDSILPSDSILSIVYNDSLRQIGRTTYCLDAYTGKILVAHCNESCPIEPCCPVVEGNVACTVTSAPELQIVVPNNFISDYLMTINGLIYMVSVSIQPESSSNQEAYRSKCSPVAVSINNGKLLSCTFPLQKNVIITMYSLDGTRIFSACKKNTGTFQQRLHGVWTGACIMHLSGDSINFVKMITVL